MLNEEIANRFGYHPPSSDSIWKHEDVRERFKEFASEIDWRMPEGREKALCYTALQEASMWAHAAIAMTDPVE